MRSLEQAEEEYLRLLKKVGGIMKIPSLRSERNLVWKQKLQPDTAEASTKPALTEPLNKMHKKVRCVWSVTIYPVTRMILRRKSTR